jgi:outer membrane lipoprotein-sorting protein
MKQLFAVSMLLLFARCASMSAAKVDEIIASNLAARGGKANIQALNSIRATGTVTGSGGRVAHVVREIKRPGRFRVEFTYQGTTSVFAHDGNSGWQVAPLQGQFEPTAMGSEMAAGGGDDQRDIEGTLVDWRKKRHVVTLAGHELVDGKDTFKLKVDMRNGTTRYDYIDAASHQIIRSDVTRIIQGHPTVLQTTFSDFRETDGLVFPRVIETRAKDRPQVLRIAVDSIELNPAIDDAHFRMPK